MTEKLILMSLMHENIFSFFLFWNRKGELLPLCPPWHRPWPRPPELDFATYGFWTKIKVKSKTPNPYLKCHPRSRWNFWTAYPEIPKNVTNKVSSVKPIGQEPAYSLPVNQAYYQQEMIKLWISNSHKNTCSDFFFFWQEKKNSVQTLKQWSVTNEWNYMLKYFLEYNTPIW